ncbi:hypothetical protein [Virgibacillus salexigens]|uniref:DUF3955 domain-containing protein n=1 Tax=Virgibacillus massiliensis TaxID=1462526 RepID=A0A024QGQ9_9BACI|nr:hypothetical protein [Virgibacillus massiliensis]CDQ41743.1 hypothetical protein BN990_04120 [Virgibacillus massiliensis]
MKLSIIASSLLIASAILISAHFTTSALVSIVKNSLGNSLDFTYSLPLFILSILTFVVAIILILIDIKNRKE